MLESTGLKIYGAGEWKVRRHEYSKRHIWRKLHIRVATTTHEIQTEVGVDDAEVGKQLLTETLVEIEQVSADGAYDKRKFYKACTQRQVHQIRVQYLAT